MCAKCDKSGTSTLAKVQLESCQPVLTDVNKVLTLSAQVNGTDLPQSLHDAL